MATSKTKVRKGPIDFAQSFTEAVAGSQRGWQYDRTLTVGASEAFDCHRLSYFKKREPENLDDDAESDWGHTERGNVVEDKFAVPMLRAIFGAENCLYMGDEQKTFLDGRLSATPDGIVIDQARDALVKYGVPDLGENANQFAAEIKSFGGPSAAPKKLTTDAGVSYQAKVTHTGQNIIQMGMFRRQTNFKPTYGVVIYINPVRLSDIRPAVVKYDEAVYQRAKVRADDVFDLSKTAKDYKAEGKATGRCEWCAYTGACSKAEGLLFPDKIIKPDLIAIEQQAKFKETTARVVKLRADYKALETAKKTAEAELKDMLFEEGTTRVGGADWSASISKMNGKRSVSKALMEEKGLDPEDYMTQGNDYFVLRTKGE